MSIWKFNDFEVDVDFTDADFMERFEQAYEIMLKNVDNTPKVGKASEIIRSQCEVFDAFFSTIFSRNALNKMFNGKKSVELRIEACNSLYEFRNQEDKRYNNLINKYRPNYPNRQQRRHQKKKK